MAGYQNVAQRNLTCAIRIRERRRELGLTQAEVVERVDRHGSRLSNQALSAIENGRRLAVGRLPDLAEALDCTVTYLLGLTADPRSWAPDRPPRAREPAEPQARAELRTPAESRTGAEPRTPAEPRTGAGLAHRSWILGPDVPEMSAAAPAPRSTR